MARLTKERDAYKIRNVVTLCVTDKELYDLTRAQARFGYPDRGEMLRDALSKQLGVTFRPRGEVPGRKLKPAPAETEEAQE